MQTWRCASTMVSGTDDSVKSLCCSAECIQFRLKDFFFIRPLGAKTHKTSEQVRVVEKSGKSYTVKGDVGLSGLSPECRLYMELSEEVMQYCNCDYLLHLTLCILIGARLKLSYLF